MTFSMEKLEWCDGEIDTFIHFDRNHERDGRTDTQTPHRRRLHSIALTTDRHEASRGLSTTAEHSCCLSVCVLY